MPRKTNFTANGNDYFRVTKTIGKDADGKPIRKQFYGESKMEAENKRDEYMAGIKRGFAIDYDKAIFADALKNWLDRVHKPSIRLSTYQKYETNFRLRIKGSAIAGMRLVDIKDANMQDFYNSLLETETIPVIHAINRMLSVFFKHCVKGNALLRSPLSSVVLPKYPEKKTTKPLIETDIEKLINACKSDIKYFPFVFLTFTGLRSGELLALEYRDIDLQNEVIYVNKSFKHVPVDGKLKPIISEPKTTAGRRTVPIMAEIKPLLLSHIEGIKQRLDTIPIDGSYLIFPSETGTYRNENNFLRQFKTACTAIGMEDGYTIHSLRHTFCTILARQSVSLLDASRLMGHSNVNITAKIYSHVSVDDKKIAVQRLGVYFG